MDELGPAAKKRRSKTTPEQYNLFLETLESNAHFRKNKITPDNPTALTDGWEDLVKSLNASGGPKKTIPEWKRVFTDWKSQVRRRARIIKNAVRETGNKGDPEKDLTEVEKKLLHLTGDTVIEGLKGVAELGIENQLNIEAAIEEERAEEEITVQKKTASSEKKINADTLMSINDNLEKLVKLKQKEIGLLQLKLQLKYGITVTEEDETIE